MNRHERGIIPQVVFYVGQALALLGGVLYAFWVAAWIALIILLPVWALIQLSGSL